MKIIFVILLSIPFTATSQSVNLIKVVAGDDPLPYFPMAERYRYKEFMEGFVFDAAGKPTALPKMNFQLISGNLESISENGDTVIVDNREEQYKTVLIRADFFYYHKKDGYFHIVSKGEPVKLVSRLRWTIIRRDPIESKGKGVAMSSQFQSTRPDPVTGQAIKYENLVYAKVMTYYLMDAKGNTDFVGKSSFASAFPEHKKEIKAFINENQIDFDREQDLKKLHKYCISLK